MINTVIAVGSILGTKAVVVTSTGSGTDMYIGTTFVTCKHKSSHWALLGSGVRRLEGVQGNAPPGLVSVCTAVASQGVRKRFW